MGWVSQDSHPRKYIPRESENWVRKTPSNSPKTPGTKFGKKKGPSRGLIQKCAPHERGPCAPKFEESSHEETSHQERFARKAAWDLAKHMHKLKNSDETAFYIPCEVKGISTPITSKRPEEREFVVDSGASVHMMNKKELSSGEMGTVKRSRNPTVVLTADGEVHTHEEAQVFVHDLNQFVTVQLLEETLVVPSQGKLCKNHGCSYEWVSAIEPQLTNNRTKDSLQDKQFRTSCRSRFYSATTGIVGTRCTPRLWKQGCIKFIFGAQI